MVVLCLSAWMCGARSGREGGCEVGRREGVRWEGGRVWGGKEGGCEVGGREGVRCVELQEEEELCSVGTSLLQ